MKYTYENYYSLIVINKNLTKEYFLKEAGAMSGYAVELFSRIYDAIFSEADDIADLYNQYYSVEYDSIPAFLYHKYCIDHDIIDKLLAVKNSDNDHIIIMIYDLSYGKSDLVSFAFSDSMYDRMTNVLLMKNNHENKN